MFFQLNSVHRFLCAAAISLIRIYQRCISPALGPRCRFFPTCSQYASDCIAIHGILRGTLLAGKRLCKCHPWHRGGVDLPPAE